MTGIFYLAIFAGLVTSHIGSCIFHMRIGILYDHYAENFYDVVHYTVEVFAAEAEHGTELIIDPVELNLDYQPNAYDHLLERDLTVIIVAAKKLSCDRLVSVKNKIPIFIVTGSFANCDEYDGINSLFYLYPSDTAVLNTMLMAAERYQWKSAIVLGEKNEEFDFTFVNMQQARERGIETVALEVSYQKDILTENLLTAKSDGIRSFVLMSQMHHVDVFLSVAREVGITDRNYHWFIPNVFVTPQVLEEFVQGGMTISLLYSPILTPLIHKIMEKESGNTSETFLMNEVVSSLTLLALESTFSACDQALQEGCLDMLGSNTTCKPNHEDLASHLQVISDSTTADATTHISVTTVEDTANISARRRSALFASIPAQESFEAQGVEACDKCVKKTYLSSICSKKNCMHSKNTKIPVSVSSKGSAEEQIVMRRKRASSTYSLNADGISPPIMSNPNPDCLLYDWNDAFISIAASITESILNQHEVPGNETTKNSTLKDTTSLSTIPQLPTILDTCAFTSINKWAYRNESCSYRLMGSSAEPLANVLYVIEYLGTEAKDKKAVIVGAYNSENRSYVSSSYEELHLYNVYLPDRDFLIGAIHHPPWLSWEVDDETGSFEFSGYLYEVLENLAREMGFTYQLLPEYDFTGDLIHVDEVEKHMFDLFANNTVDFFLHAKSIRGNRLGKSDVVYLTSSFQLPSMYLLTKRVENTEAVSIWQFMLPFREESWIVFWSSFILSTLISKVSLLMSYYNKKNPNEYEAIAHTFGPNSSASDHLGILNSLWFNFATICGQGADIVPQSTACTVLTGTWWLFLLLVVSAYTANMTAFMTQVNNEGIQTLDNLANQKEFAYGILETSAMYRLFLPQAKATPFTTIWEYLQKSRAQAVFQRQEDAFTKVLEGNFFFIADYESAVEAMAVSCEFDVRGDGFYQYQFSLPFPRGSVYIPMFNDQIRKLADEGILAQLEKKWFAIEQECEVVTTEQNLENQLDIKAFIGMYVFLALGVVGGMIICLLETGWIKYGGISGLFGRAGIYELDADRKEIKKSNELMEKEFESWDGGWDVWKFKEWKPQDDLEMVEASATPRPLSHRTGCKICGRPIKKKQLSEPREEHELQSRTQFNAPLNHKQEASDSGDSGRDSSTSDVLGATEPENGVLPNPTKIDIEKEAIETSEQTERKIPQLHHKKPLEAIHISVTEAPTLVLPSITTNEISRRTEPVVKAAKATEHNILQRDLPTQSTSSKSKPDIQKPLEKPQLIQRIVPPILSQRVSGIPMESDYSLMDERIESSLSAGSSFSHSSLASGTLSFLSDSDDSMSKIHPRTPYELSDSPSSRYSGSTLSRGCQSSFRSDASFYSTTSYDLESGGYSGRSMKETPISYLSELTEDALSDVTVISRKPRT